MQEDKWQRYLERCLLDDINLARACENGFHIILCTIIVGVLIVLCSMPPVYAGNENMIASVGYVDSEFGLKLRDRPDVSSKVIKIMPDNQKLVIMEEVFVPDVFMNEEQVWYKVRDDDGRVGYAKADNIDGVQYKSIDAVVQNVDKTANIRCVPWLNGAKVGEIAKGTKIDVVRMSRRKGSMLTWYKFRLGSAYYYISEKRIRFAGEVADRGCNSSSNLRSNISCNTSSRTSCNIRNYKNTYNESNEEGTKALMEINRIHINYSEEISSVESKDDITKGHTGEEGKDGGETELLTETPISTINSDRISNETSNNNSVKTIGKTALKSMIKSSTAKKTLSRNKNTASRRIANMALKIAWNENASSRQYRYKGGSATSSFKRAINAVFPSRGWSAPSHKGASCDVFVGTVVRSTGYDRSYPRGFGEQLPHLRKSKKWKKVSGFSESSRSISRLRNGDIILYKKKGNSVHTLIYYDKGDGDKGRIEAGYGKTFGHVVKGGDSLQKKLNSSNIRKLYAYRAVK